MLGSAKLANEIAENASMIPVECQEHILDVIKAMRFTRMVVEKEMVEKEKAEGKENA